MNPRPRILYLSPCWPNEKSFGTQLRVRQVANALREVGELKFVVVRFDDDEQSAKQSFGPNQEVIDFVELQVAPPRAFSSTLRCSFDPSYLGMHGQVIDPGARARVLARLQDFDLIWLHHMFVPNVFGLWKWPRSVMDVDDVPSIRELGIFRSGQSLKERWHGGFRYWSARRREERFESRFKVLSVCSERDRKHLNLPMPVHVIPNGFKRPTSDPIPQPVNPPRIGFIGLLSYPPNVEGVRWFVDHCWNKIRKQFPEARLRLIGKDSDGELFPRDASIDGLGWVADPEAEIATWSAMIVPVRTGAGTRVKIAEGFSRKCPMVSTSLGAYGYDVRNGEELLLADDPSEFADACLRLLQAPELGCKLAARGWERFLTEWTWEAIAPRVQATAEDCLRRSKPVEQEAPLAYNREQ